MLCQVGMHDSVQYFRDDRIPCSYDLDLDTRLAEETTVLVESYTVQSLRTFREFQMY